MALHRTLSFVPVGTRRLSTRAGVGHSGHLSGDASLRNEHDGPAVAVGLSAKQKYLFDLNGYLVIRNAFSPEEVARANSAIDAHIEKGHLHERQGQLRTSGLYGRQSTPLQGDGSTGRFDMGGMLGWEKPFCEPFRDVLCHSALLPALTDLLGVGYRLDHSPLLIAMEKGSEGHTLHGGAVTEAGEPAWPLAYECRQGHMRNQLLTVGMQLTPARVGDGGFCAVPGSHKSNFSVPPALADLADSELNEVVVQPELLAGDALVFSESVLHGTLPWHAEHQRRTVIYRFAPAGSAYGRGYLHEADATPNAASGEEETAARGSFGSWPRAALAGMSEAQRAVMLAPYHPRMNRPYLDPGSFNGKEATSAKAREAFKVEFDEKVFGAKYF